MKKNCPNKPAMIWLAIENAFWAWRFFLKIGVL